MIVVDASALVVAVVDTSARSQAAGEAMRSGPTAPHLVDAELGHALWGLVRRRLISPAHGLRSLALGHDLVLERVDHSSLMGRAWELRDNVSFYDALYVALAEARALTLLTADARLAASPGPRCEFEVV